LELFGRRGTHLTHPAGVANSFPPVTTFSVLQPGSPGYPDRLTALGFDRKLYVRGTLGAETSVSIVGARAASGVGMDRAHVLGRHFAERGVRVVSGGALGIDGAAHRGALAGRGVTTVVLGSGIDVAYPARHAKMFDAVLATGGALVSLLPPGVLPRDYTFVQRNPLIAALGAIVIVVEADVRSGSLSTAKAARQLGRVVCAWPGSPGCDQLLDGGAAIVESTDDADRALAGTPRYPEPAILDDTSARIADAIARGARDVDAIVLHTGLSVRAVLRALPLMNARKP
jgi:DNA processing protein